MVEENHKLGLIYCQSIIVCIDMQMVNVESLYAIDKCDRKINAEDIDVEFEALEVKVKGIEDIALVMNRETFDRFCELWREYHDEE